MSKSNTVSVRFESTPENKVSDKTSYVQMVGTDFKSNIQYYKKDASGSYVVADPINSYSSTTTYYYKNSTFLISGPIEIFATVDVLYSIETVNEVETHVSHPTAAEMLETAYLTNSVFDIEKYEAANPDVKIGLLSPYVTKLSSEYNAEYGLNVVIFVENVTNLQDTQTYRGAYFLYEGTEGTTPMWKEILLGTHSHDNIEVLESLEGLPYKDISKEAIITVDANGNFVLKAVDSLAKEIPDLPQEVLDKINELKKYKDIYEPTELVWNHLYAPYDRLQNTYDWNTKDENGNYTNTAIGNNIDMYRALIRADKKLYITSGYKLSRESGIAWINLNTENVNGNAGTRVDGCVNAIVSPTDATKIIISIDLTWNILESDILFFYKDKALIDDADYQIISSAKNKAAIQVLASEFTGVFELTVLSAHNFSGSRSALAAALKTNADISLTNINEELYKLYIEGEFDRKPFVPKMYLSTNEKGEIEWDNKFLPSQTFYAKTLTIDSAYIAEHTVDTNYIQIEFEGTNYNVNEDFPLLMVDDFFAFNVAPTFKNLNIVYKLPINGSSAHYDFELEAGEYRKVTLVVIKNSSSGELSEELARNYVSKADAVAILAHGKLNLSDYAKKTELNGYSKLGHTHSEYALKGHNHDERYANFHHTHPELIALFKELSGTTYTEEQINAWIDKIISQNQAQLASAIENLGFTSVDGKYIIYDSNLAISDSIKTAINNKIDADGSSQTKLSMTDPVYLKTALEYIFQFFTDDTSLTSQVLLDNDIPVKLVNGPVGGIDTEKLYKANTSIKTVLEDILNPYKTVSEVRAFLTPDASKSSIHWFIYKDNEMVEIEDTEKIVYSTTSRTLYFTITTKNSIGKDCIYDITKTGAALSLSPVLSFVGTVYPSAEINGKDYYVYSEDFSFSTKLESYPNIEYTWVSNQEADLIYDNYGLNSEKLNPDSTSIKITPSFNIIYADYYIGSLTSDVNFGSLISELSPKFNKSSSTVTILTSATPFLAVAVKSSLEDSLKIFADGVNITNQFSDYESSLTIIGPDSYILKTYEVYTGEEITFSVEF